MGLPGIWQGGRRGRRGHVRCWILKGLVKEAGEATDSAGANGEVDGRGKVVDSSCTAWFRSGDWGRRIVTPWCLECDWGRISGYHEVFSNYQVVFYQEAFGWVHEKWHLEGMGVPGCTVG